MTIWLWNLPPSEIIVHSGEQMILCLHHDSIYVDLAIKVK